MPKETRKARKARKTKEEKLPPISVPAAEEVPPEIMAEPVAWGIQKKLMLRCPCCGRVGEPSFTSRRTGVMVGISDGPYELEIFLQRFGGSMPSPTGDMKDRPGYMEYLPTPEQLEEWRPIVIEKLKAALEQLEE